MEKKEPFPRRLRQWILTAASALGYFRLFAFLNRRKIAILLYHGVSGRDAFPGIENYQGKHVRASLFRRHLAFLSRRYKVLPLPDVLHALRTGMPLPPYTVVITFDAGYENNVTEALPALRKEGIPAAFFLTTGYIGTDRSLWVDQLEQTLNDTDNTQVFVRFALKRETIRLGTDEERREADRLIRWFCKQLTDEEKKTWLKAFFAENGIEPPKARGDYRFMTWGQARELHAAGMTVGSHTLTHAIVTRLTAAEMEREIANARAACEDHLGVPCEAFAYPNGRPGDFNKDSNALLRRLGFSCGLTTLHGLNRADANLYALRRVGVSDQTSVRELEAHLSGLTTLAQRLRKTLFG